MEIPNSAQDILKFGGEKAFKKEQDHKLDINFDHLLRTTKYIM